MKLGVALRAVLAGAVLLPLFFQLRGTIYRSARPLLDSGGSLASVPLPLSLAACAVAIVVAGLFARPRIKQAAPAFAIGAALFAAMALTTVISARGFDLPPRKVLLLVQVLAPLSGLVAGMMFHAGADRVLEKTFLWVLTVLVPLQLILTLASGDYATTHDMILFSIYQHRQFVPVVLVAAYLVALFALWQTRSRPVLFVLGLIMGVHAAMSFSMLSVGLLLLGLLAFVGAIKSRGSVALAAAVAVVVAAGFWQLRDTNEFRAKSDPAFVSPYLSDDEAMMERTRNAAVERKYLPENVRSRMEDWTLYGRGILESPATAAFGHRETLERAVSTSAHNYYLDFVYNFGSVAIVPLLALLAYTFYLLARQRRALYSDPAALGVVFVVLFMLLIDSNFKVTLRQPYPGAFTFFLWGLLLSRLRLRA